MFNHDVAGSDGLELDTPTPQNQTTQPAAPSREEITGHLEPCPSSGSGVHRWLLGSANRLLNAGLLTEETREVVADALHGEMTRPPQPPSEIESAIDRALRDAGREWRTPERTRTPEFNLRVATALAGDYTDALARLESLSPVPTDTSTADYLRHLFTDGDKVCIVNSCTAGGFVWEPHGETDLRLFPVLPEGVWFVSNSISGEAIRMPSGRPSIRCRQAVAAGRFLLLECDHAELSLDMQAAMIGNLRLPIVSVVTSGGKSLHALAQISDGDIATWFAAKERLKAILPEYGFDPAAMTLERLTRLPGYRRSENGQGAKQRLVYLDPGARAQLSIFAKGGLK